MWLLRRGLGRSEVQMNDKRMCDFGAITRVSATKPHPVGARSAKIPSAPRRDIWESTVNSCMALLLQIEAFEKTVSRLEANGLALG